MISRVLLFPNASRDIGLAVTRQAAALLRSRGVEPLLPTETEGAEDLAEEVRLLPLDAALQRAELIVTLGGDGTILRIAKEAAERALPILGIQMGRLGFLAELDVENLPGLLGITRENFTVDERMMLSLAVYHREELVYEDLALNEALLIGGPTGRFVPLTVLAERRQIMSFSGDGVIVATPTGSTAYSMAAGGPIVEPEAESIIITPVCAHALYAKAIVLAPGRAVTIVSHHDRPVYLSVDGKEDFSFLPEHRLVARRAQYKTGLVHLKEPDFFGLLGEKFRV